MAKEAGAGRVLEAAAKRLDQAVTLLEQRMRARVAAAGAEAGGAFDADRAKLAEALDAARARERALEEAGAEASAALGRAIAEIRSALGDDDEEDASDEAEAARAHDEAADAGEAPPAADETTEA